MCGTCSKVQHCSEGMEHKLFEDTQLNQIEPTGARVPDNLNICVTLVQDALVGHSCATLFLRRSSIKLLWANQIQQKTVDGNGTQTKLRLWAGKKHLEHFQLIALRHCNVDGNIGPFKQVVVCALPGWEQPNKSQSNNVILRLGKTKTANGGW